MNTETIVRTFSPFQIQFLRGKFIEETHPFPHNSLINKIARTDDGAMIIEYQQYGKMQCIRIDWAETMESYCEKELNKTATT